VNHGFLSFYAIYHLARGNRDLEPAKPSVFLIIVEAVLLGPSPLATKSARASRYLAMNLASFPTNVANAEGIILRWYDSDGDGIARGDEMTVMAIHP